MPPPRSKPGKLRFWLILMTSFAFIAGLLPLVIATGAGAIGNRTIGTTVLGGMLAGTLIGVLVIPGLYVLLQSMREWVKRRGSTEPQVESNKNSGQPREKGNFLCCCLVEIVEPFQQNNPTGKSP